MSTRNPIHTVHRPALSSSPSLRGVQDDLPGVRFAGRKSCYACNLGICQMDDMPNPEGPVC